MGNNHKILSNDDYQTIIDYSNRVNSSFEEFSDKLRQTLDAFKNEEVVRSFEQAGAIGKDQIARLEKISNILKDMETKISNLSDKTSNWAAMNIEYLNN